MRIKTKNISEKSLVQFFPNWVLVYFTKWQKPFYRQIIKQFARHFQLIFRKRRNIENRERIQRCHPNIASPRLLLVCVPPVKKKTKGSVPP